MFEYLYFFNGVYLLGCKDGGEKIKTNKQKGFVVREYCVMYTVVS